MASRRHQAEATRTRIDRERGRTSGVQRQRRQPGAIKRRELLLQDQYNKRLNKLLSERGTSLDALMDVLRSNPSFHNTLRRQRIFEQARII